MRDGRANRDRRDVAFCRSVIAEAQKRKNTETHDDFGQFRPAPSTEPVERPDPTTTRAYTERAHWTGKKG